MSATAAPLPRASDYLPMVQRMAHRLRRRLPQHVQVEDLIGAGVVGLMESIARFDPKRSRDFAAFVEFRIRGAMLDELRRSDPMARDARREAKRLEAVLGEMAQVLGHPPSEEAVAQRLGLSLEALHARLSKLALVNVVGLDEVLAPTEASGVFDEVARRERHRHLAAAIGRLAERQQQVLALYYQEELTLREIGSAFGVSESRACQILAAATLQLRAFLRAGESP